jgi:hypothetical protein
MTRAPLALVMTGGHAMLGITTYWSLWASGGPGEPELNELLGDRPSHCLFVQ